jgi:uncharacterized protein (TIGR00730 family)
MPIPLRSVCIYCGSSPGMLPEYTAAAFAAGEHLAAQDLTLVYGGGSVGLMGAVADGALSAGGRVIGVMPQHLIDREIAHPRLTELHAVSSMHERKLKMAELSDAFVALPGGVGTLEEIFEVYTWTQLGLQSKPCAFLNVAGYYDSLISFLEHTVTQRFVRAEHHASLLIDTCFATLLQRLRDWQPATLDKWLDSGR